MPVLALQHLCFSELPDELKQIQVSDPQKTLSPQCGPQDLKKFVRFAMEEYARRGLKRDAAPLTQEQILGLLYPDFKNLKETTLHRLKT